MANATDNVCVFFFSQFSMFYISLPPTSPLTKFLESLILQGPSCSAVLGILLLDAFHKRSRTITTCMMNRASFDLFNKHRM